jgi:hypothetical protein
MPPHEQIRAAVEAVLPRPARPWAIEVNRQPVTDSWRIELQHEASFGFVFETGDVDADAAIARVRQYLRGIEPELARVAAAPVLVHREDVMGVRSLAHVFNWSKMEVASVVRFVEPSMLTHDEAEWLIEWIGHDGPVPRPSRDF